MRTILYKQQNNTKDEKHHIQEMLEKKKFDICTHSKVLNTHIERESYMEQIYIYTYIYIIFKTFRLHTQIGSKISFYSHSKVGMNTQL